MNVYGCTHGNKAVFIKRWCSKWPPACQADVKMLWNGRTVLFVEQPYRLKVKRSICFLTFVSYLKRRVQTEAWRIHCTLTQTVVYAFMYRTPGHAVLHFYFSFVHMQYSSTFMKADTECRCVSFFLLSCSITQYVWDCFNGSWRNLWMVVYLFFCYLIYNKWCFSLSFHGNKLMKLTTTQLWSQPQRHLSNL